MVQHVGYILLKLLTLRQLEIDREDVFVIGGWKGRAKQHFLPFGKETRYQHKEQFSFKFAGNEKSSRGPPIVCVPRVWVGAEAKMERPHETRLIFFANKNGRPLWGAIQNGKSKQKIVVDFLTLLEQEWLGP